MQIVGEGYWGEPRDRAGGGVLRTGPDEWPPLGRPEYLRQALDPAELG
ncbi:hypothetical protein [Actinoplanes sp. NPDC051851]